jgi:hypothetical protein
VEVEDSISFEYVIVSFLQVEVLVDNLLELGPEESESFRLSLEILSLVESLSVSLSLFRFGIITPGHKVLTSSRILAHSWVHSAFSKTFSMTSTPYSARRSEGETILELDLSVLSFWF